MVLIDTEHDTRDAVRVAAEVALRSFVGKKLKKVEVSTQAVMDGFALGGLTLKFEDGSALKLDAHWAMDMAEFSLEVE